MVFVIVDNRIRMTAKLLGPKALAALKAAHEHVNPDVGKNRAMGYSTWGMPAKIKTWRVDGDEISVPRGGMARVREVLKEHGIAFHVTDARSEGAIVSTPFTYRGLPLRPHQKDMVRIGMAKEQCIIRGATGSGKTIAAFALAAETGLNTLVILPTKGLFQQWAKVADKVLGVRGDALGMIGDGKFRLRPLTIAMQASMGSITKGDTPTNRDKLQRVVDYFGAVIGDEIQRAAADSLYRAFDVMPAKYRFGFSASEKRKDRKEFLTYDILSKSAYEATREQMTELGIITDVEIRIVPTNFYAPWYEENRDFNRLLDEMTADEARNAIVTEIIGNEVGNGEQAIVLTHRREHARSLEQMFVGMLGTHEMTGLMLGDEEPGDAVEFQRSVAGIELGDIRVGVGTYGALGYGIDLPAISVGIATTPIATNEQNFNQVRGRLCRVVDGKTIGRLYVLVDLKTFGIKHVRNIVAWNNTVTIRDGSRWVDAREWLRKKTFR